jgi:hypothetical protein
LTSPGQCLDIARIERQGPFAIAANLVRLLKTLNHPTLVTHGEMSHAHAKLINDGVSKCIPRALQVSFSNLIHDAPSRESGGDRCRFRVPLSRR